MTDIMHDLYFVLCPCQYTGILEESGVFTPQTIAHLRNESGKHEVPDNSSESVLSETLSTSI